MNALAPINFDSAYRQLRPAEKVFVDAYVSEIEVEADRRREKISHALDRPIPADAVEASRGMLERPLVRAAVAERVKEIAAASEITPQRVLKELSNLSFSSMGDYMTIGEDGYPYFDLARCNPDQLRAIQHVKTEILPRGGMKFEIKLHDKFGPLQKFLQFMGLDQPDNPHWRAENAKPVNAAALPADATDKAAADLYARMLTDG